MDFKEYLEKYNAQAKIDKLAKLHKNRRIAIYGAGQFTTCLFENYDLSKLNIVAVADIKFEEKKDKGFFNLNCITPKELGEYDCDIILITNFNYNYFLKYLDDEILYGTKNANIEIRPMIKLDFKDLFLAK